MIRVHNTQYSVFLHQADVMRRSGKMCDAIISVENQVFRAHRLVLACASKTLENQLAEAELPNNIEHPHHCSLKLLSPHTFQQVLDFAYSECLEVTADDLPQLLRAAKLLEMHHLEEQCYSQLKALGCLMSKITDTKEKGDIKETQKIGEIIASHKTRESQVTKVIDDRKSQKQSPNPEKGVCQRITSVDAKSQNVQVTEDLVFPNNLEDTCVPSTQDRLNLLTPTSVTKTLPPARDSVIATTATNSQPPPSPPSASRFMWHQVNALRKMALNYNDLLAAQSSLHPSHMVTYPFPLSAPNMYPLLTSSIQPHVPRSALGYQGIHHPYHRPLLSSSCELGDILKQGLLGKRDQVQKEMLGGAPEGQRFSPQHPERTQDCQHCSKVLVGNSWLQESATNSSGSSRSSLGYKYCECGFRVERPLRSHRRAQDGEKPYQCKRCAKRFSLKHQLDTHHRVHTGEKPFECRLCGQRSRDYSAMIKHLRTHGGATPYQCTACLEFCSSLAAMQKHLKNHPLQDFPPDWTISRTYLYTCHT
ncbi:hypothetical protein UPYG_G00151700 [Umbra pygmaea]|uniref:Uncharacterized protein n=1 Tax=Umbra pygmaea TaxID=75934 RepID=A0ABD0WXJ0_UMBPY